jgi:hypothetical protein
MMPMADIRGFAAAVWFLRLWTVVLKDFTRQVELALFYDAKLDPAAMVYTTR